MVEMEILRRGLYDVLGGATKSTQIYTNTSTTNISIPSNALYCDIFLVGGGGGGGAWNTWGYTNGTPGCGGGCFCKRMIPLFGVTSMSYKCGLGGLCSTNKTSAGKWSEDGESTSITIGSTKYIADGGSGGYNSFLNSDLTNKTYPNGNSNNFQHWLAKCYDQYPSDNRTTTNFGVEGSYQQGLTFISNNCFVRYDGIYESEIAEQILTLRSQIAYPDVIDVYEFGIPAFYENGMDTFAPQGSGVPDRLRYATTCGPEGGVIVNPKDKLTRVDACGYGGGGYGGIYREGEIMYGGNGSNGAVVIRWYLV